MTTALVFETALGVLGLALAFSIWWSKHDNVSLVCPFDGTCDEVMRSRYSRFLGIPLEVFGMAYYAFVIVISGAFLLVPDVFFSSLGLLFFLVTLVSAIFSCILSGIQFFALHSRCIWCFGSAVISIAIFIIAFLWL